MRPEETEVNHTLAITIHPTEENGGLIVDKEARVLDENDAPISNLFAVGELTCVQALDVVHFSAGENISWNLYSGRIAGAEMLPFLCSNKLLDRKIIYILAQKVDNGSDRL